MKLIAWEDLPASMQTEAVRPYYEALQGRALSLACKRVFDVVVSALMLVVLAPVFLLLAIAIKLDSPGPVFYRQVRVTQYGKQFRIFKFRSMVQNADKIGAQVTVGNDRRITRMGKLIRKCRLDELCQLIDVFRGTMTFVGTRPEVPKYVAAYTPEMWATLLLPAGITSEASILYKDENRLLEINFQNARCTEDTNLNKYVNKKRSAGKVDMVISIIIAVYLMQQAMLSNTELDWGIQVI